MAGAIEMSRRWRVITTPSANANIMTTESTRPSPCAPPGPPTMRPTPTNATAIATTVRREIDSRSATQAISAAAIGDAACMKSTLATVVWLSATMKQPEARAVRAATASEAARIDVKAVTTCPRSMTATKARSASAAKTARPAIWVAVLTSSSRWSTPAVDHASAASTM